MHSPYYWGENLAMGTGALQKIAEEWYKWEVRHQDSGETDNPSIQ
jgi:hypothetical protein